MGQKKYMSIHRLSEHHTDSFHKGDEIIVQEKLDGSNYSVYYDEDSDSLHFCSRENRITEELTLQGAWEWSQGLDKEKFKEILGVGRVLFGEWLVRHTIVYREEVYKNVYFFDIWDRKEEKYLHPDEVKEIVDKLGLTYVPVFYRGKFTSWDELRQYVGKSEYAVNEGEGIIVKNISKLNDTNPRYYYTKIVTDKFAEKKAVKVVDPAKIAERERLQAITESIVTEARVRKLIYKLVEGGVITENWGKEDMRVIAQNLGSAVYYDCVKEEPEVVDEVGELFGKFAAGTAMRLAKEFLEERETERLSNQ